MRPDQFYHSTTPTFWNSELEEEFGKYAIDEYPNEACAFVINNELIIVKNIATDPQNRFELSTEDSNLIMKAQGFIHSHPNGPISPSQLDMISQKSASIPFGIMVVGMDSHSNTVWISDQNLSIHLEERPFLHGVFDCYSLIRSYYWQSRQIKLLDFPRDDNWWELYKDQDLYMKNFEAAGFKEIGVNDTLQEGDIILMNIQTDVVSHAAIYIGDNLILHHLRDKISKKDHATSWKKFYHTVVRYSG